MITHAVARSTLVQKQTFYVCSLSCRTLVYKGLMLADQIKPFLPDLTDPDMVSGLALVHQRYSTNTFPAWNLAQPFRFICHNGEINTVRGNINFMHAREVLLQSPLFGSDIKKLFPIITPGTSDSGALDNAVELLYHSGRSLPHAMMMLIPEAWENHATMSDEKKAFYEYHSTFMEPWDGPAAIPFTDGQCVGAILDRNGLRPSRYCVTRDGHVIMASETGALEIAPDQIVEKGRLEPGRMFLVDTEAGRIIDDEEIKHDIASRQPYRAWLSKNLYGLNDLPVELPSAPIQETTTLTQRQRMFGYTLEDLKILLAPMANRGSEAIGSMGVDIPLAVLSDRPQLLYNYFKQLFAQVTNPPLDAIREELVTSLQMNIGKELNLLEETDYHAHQLRIDQPILTNDALERIRAFSEGDIRTITLPTLFRAADGGEGLAKAMDELQRRAVQAVDDGYSILILSDRGGDAELAPIPAALAVAGVHHHLIRHQRRTQCGLVVESGEVREVHHFAVLFGYGASAVNPYMVYEIFPQMIREGQLEVKLGKAISNYIKAVNKGLLKVMSKMGISTLHSYRGAQIFECLGLNRQVVNDYFTGTFSRIQGVGLDIIAKEAQLRHAFAFPPRAISGEPELDAGGVYQWRRTGERHILTPLIIAKLQEATRTASQSVYDEFAGMVNHQAKELCTLRGLFTFNTQTRTPVPIDEVEPWQEIVKRFKTGAMSYGSISKEAHETLATAMNRLGAKSNSGEGGEDAERFVPLPNGDSHNSAIKQVASARFGVTSHYLSSARELQIKMAQGAKPGEGGQLPADKVYPWIAKTRHATPYVQLISPPPHHDIYSIEDLAQLIHDLKNANPDARVSVKLVSQAGVGTVAAGVAKAKADVVLISGYDGGTGASPETSLKHTGLPWELGLSETHQTLVLNDLRSRIVVECDGKLLTGRDVAIACLLGAEEFGFATAPLITLGCVMMRVCHLNTCPVGIATQDPELRKKFAGQPEYVVNYFHFVAEELRAIMASLGFRSLPEMVGQSDCLNQVRAIDHWKAKGLDLSCILHKPEVSPAVGLYQSRVQDHGLNGALDHELIRKAAPALERGEKVNISQPVRNINRSFGTMLSHQISRRYGAEGLPDDTITIQATGSGGQSFGAFAARGVTIDLEGDANDYFGKGLSGARLVVRPPGTSRFVPERNILIGNVALYGAIDGQAYINGIAGERFAVRNSGVQAVVEGVGDHGCEYMTGGVVVVLGRTGRNFAAGMSGGIAYVLDEQGDFGTRRCNVDMVELESLVDDQEIAMLRSLIERHAHYTASPQALRLLSDWKTTLSRMIRVIPRDYKKAMEKSARSLPVTDTAPAGAPELAMVQSD